MLSAILFDREDVREGVGQASNLPVQESKLLGQAGSLPHLAQPAQSLLATAIADSDRPRPMTMRMGANSPWAASDGGLYSAAQPRAAGKDGRHVEIRTFAAHRAGGVDHWLRRRAIPGAGMAPLRLPPRH